VKIVTGAEADQATLRIQKLVIDVHEEHVLTVVQTGDDLVRFFDFETIGVRGPRAAREDGQQQNLRIRKILAELEDVGADALGDFRSGCAAGVVGADHQHDRFGLMALSFAVLKTPQHALRRIARDAEVGDLYVAEILAHDSLAAGVAEWVTIGAKEIGDGIPNEHDVKVAVFGALHQRGLAVPAGAGSRADAWVIARERNVYQ